MREEVKGRSPPPKLCNGRRLRSVGERENYMTKREFLNAIIESEIAEELKAFATAEIEKMDMTNAKRKAKPSKTAIQNAEIGQHIVEEILTKEPQSTAEIAEKAGISVQKAAAILNHLVEEEKISKGKMKGTKGKINSYCLF